MNEFEARDYILNKGKEVEDTYKLRELISEVENNFNYDYGVSARAVGAVVTSVANYLSRKMGLTGFQASFVMWDFIKAYMKSNNECGMKLVDYDDMLYPQYSYKFQKTISKETWENIVKSAKENLERDNKFASKNVIAHWKSIVDGNVPFGYVVEEE